MIERRDVAFVENLLYSRLDAQHTVCHLVLTNQMIDVFHLHFTSEKTEAQRSQVICLRWLHSEKMAGF